MTNKLVLLPDDGEEPIVRAIKSAKKTIWVKMFALTNRNLFQALVEAHEAGKQLRILLNAKHTHGPRDNDAAFAAFAGHMIATRFTPDRFSVTHEKSMVIDSKVAYVFGFNWQDKAFHQRDFGFMTKDPVSVARIADCFKADWKNDETFVPDNSGKVIFSPGPMDRYRFLELIYSATSTLVIEHEKICDLPVIEAIVAAKARNVKVRIVIPPISELDPPYQLLGKAALRLLHSVEIEVRALKKPKPHGKLILADGKSAIVGSHNMHPSAFEDRRELSLIISNRLAMKRLGEAFDIDWDAAKRVNPGNPGLPEPPLGAP